MPAQETSKATLDYSETLFSMLSALNSCGYDQELGVSHPLRARLRAEISQAVAASEAAGSAREQLCSFYADHRQPDASRDLSQYISLALNLGEPPTFALTVKEADLPPDAAYVLGIVPHLERFYTAANLHALWEKYRFDYDQQVERLRGPLAQMLLATDMYMRMPSSGYIGRRFVVYLEPLGAPGQVNARNYGADYFVVLSPAAGPTKMHEIRHTYLHYVLDPLALKRANTMKRLAPLLASVATAPLDKSFKNDIALLVTESLVRAIEARLTGKTKADEPARAQAAANAVREGYILARYFHDALARFEEGPVGLKDAYPDFLHNISVDRERKLAEQVQFTAQAVPEVVQASAPGEQLLEQAESKLAAGDVSGAQALAQQVLEQGTGDRARVLFVLARAATLNRDMQGARTYFERTLEAAKEPRLLAWAHIYLGRIFDLQENRAAALQHYRAALQVGDAAADTRSAAQRGLQHPYEPPVARNQR